MHFLGFLTLLFFHKELKELNKRDELIMKAESKALISFIASASLTSNTIEAFGGHGSSSLVFTQLSKATSANAVRQPLRPLKGILDEIEGDSFVLGGGNAASGGGGARSKNIEDAYEMFLAELVFSPNDPRLDIVEKWEQSTDPDFTGWLKSKFEMTRDAEERAALRDLYDMIMDLIQVAELSQQAEQRAQEEADATESERIAAAEKEASEGQLLSKAEVLKKASAVGGVTAEDKAQGVEAASKKKSFLEQETTPEIRLSYEALVQELLPPFKGGTTVTSAVYNAYERCDAQLIKILEEKATNGDGDADAQAALDAIAQEQEKRLAAATERLRTVLQAGDPMRMEGAVVKLAKEGRIDEPFLLLLEVNANQAMAAGATGPAALMMKLKERAMTEKDKVTQSKEIALLRKLLRTDDPAQRELILTDAFTPREQLLVQGTAANAAKALDGEAPDQEKPEPDVPPPDFIAACKAVLINFGNLGTEEKGDLNAFIKQIAAEAEVVATRIYGKGMTPQEQQDRAWKETTTSIFDLETIEIEAQRMGDAAPWTNPDNEDILPGFDSGGKMKIGGTD
jgi:hypothetical protein